MAILTVLPMIALLQLFWLPAPDEPSGNRVFIRKNQATLSKLETDNIYSVVNLFVYDEGPRGYKHFSAYYNNQSGCAKTPGGSRTYCATHGKATYLLRNRLYLAHVEQTLASYDGFTGLFYYDWTRVQMPMRKQTFISRLPPNNFLLESVLLALEQDDYCRFALMLEMALIQALFYNDTTADRLDDIAVCHITANADRMFVLWQQLQEKRGRRAAVNCGLNLFHEPLGPFDREYSNRFNLRRVNAEPTQLLKLSASLDLGYSYDDLSVDGRNVTQLNQLLRERQSTPRSFASFRLTAIETSAKLRIRICVPQEGGAAEVVDVNCNNDAGSFFVLGKREGDSFEQSWDYGYPYLFEITDVVTSLGIPLDGHYYVHADISTLDGTQLRDDIIPLPIVTYIPPQGGHTDERIVVSEFPKMLTWRKNLNSLNEKEEHELRVAMECFADDKSMQGYQTLAEYSGLLRRCPQPESTRQLVCSVHGSATFLHWNRLAVKQLESSLRRCGSSVGVPYWDWTDPTKSLPLFVSNESYYDPDRKELRSNPFSRLSVDFLSYDKRATRNTEWVAENLKDEKHRALFSQLLFAFEQEDFCDFEIQLEVLQNSLYNIFLVSEFRTLDHMPFDPLFWMHCSQVDRLWAIWQALQLHRGLPSMAYCVLSELHRPLKPFSSGPPINRDWITYAHSTPGQVHDYNKSLHYKFNSLRLGADMFLAVTDLHTRIEDQKKKDRVFVGFLLHGIKTSAKIHVTVKHRSGKYEKSGVSTTLASILIYGSREENDWSFDRYYKHEITRDLSRLGYDYVDGIHLEVLTEDINGTALPDNILPEPVIIYVPNKHNSKWSAQYLPTHERKLVDTLTSLEELDIRESLRMFKADETATGFQRVSALHGSFQWCPYLEAPVKYICCHHNSITFLPWHRLLMINFENGMRRNGNRIGTPYWDWTKPMKNLPKLASDEVYRDFSGEIRENPFLRTHIDYLDVDTVRDVNKELFHPDEHRRLHEKVLNALEQMDFEYFEAELEHVHNTIHLMVGGSAKYSMSYLEYAAYDPIFFLHHSMVDRIWAIWQKMYNVGLPDSSFESLESYGSEFNQTMSPFNISTVNIDPITSRYSIPWKTFDYETNFQYGYDNLNINGKSTAVLRCQIRKRQARNRWFIIAHDLESIKQSYIVRFYITFANATSKPFNTTEQTLNASNTKLNASNTKLNASNKSLNASNKKLNHNGETFYAGAIYVFSGKWEMPKHSKVPHRIEITDLDRLRTNKEFVLQHKVFDIRNKEIHNVALKSGVVFVPKRERRPCVVFAGHQVCSHDHC